ncbi:MAG: SusC/RagA family TonB-linked outer membrane protein [Marinifilaceae bacterium]
MKNIFSKISFLIISLMLLSMPTIAQEVIRGIVRDAHGPLIGATVCVINESNRVMYGAVTNLDGEFILKAPTGKGMTIQCSFIGYTTKKVKYTGQTVLNFTLNEETNALDEVVIRETAVERGNTGVAVKDMGVAREKITMEGMSELQATSVEDALQGRLSNVDIIASSGDPGSKMAIRIRGTSSLSANNEPLIVVDGIPYVTEISDDFDFATADQEDFGALVNISPSDIESIEVLKDAAATAMWGSQGANGVLVITTKKGSRGKTRFNISQKVDFKHEPKNIPMLNGEQYVTLIHDAMWNRMGDVGYHWSEMDRLIKYPEINFDPEFKYYDEYNQNTNWLNEITRNGLSSETDFSMSGGGDRALYRFSVGYLTDQGTTMGTQFTRLNTRLNVDYRFSDRLRVSSQFSFSQGEKNEPWSTNVRSHARVKMPNMSPYLLDDNGNRTEEYFVPVVEPDYTPFQGTWSNVFNPIAMAELSKNNTTNRDIRLAFSLKYDILRSLTFSQDVAFDIGTSKNKKYLPKEVTGVSSAHKDYNRGEDNMTDKVSMNLISKLIYNKQFNERNSLILTGTAHIKEYTSSNHASGVKGLGSSNVSDPSAGGDIVTFGSGKSSSRSVGFFGAAHYKYNNRYMFNVSYRMDGNSKMGKSNRWGGFPSASVAWRFSEEGLFKNLNFLNDSEIRASWGKNGNSPNGSYPYIGTFQANTDYIGDPSVGPATIQLNNLKWEMVTQKNIGMDLLMMNARLSLTFDLYSKVSDDLLQQNVTIPSTTGYSQISYYNSGKMENKGWEFRFNLRDIVKINHFGIDVNFNISQNINKVLKLPVNKRYDSYTFGNGNYASNVVIGDPLGSFYGYKYLGVYDNVAETVATNRYGDDILDIQGDPVYTSINNLRVRPGDAHYDDINKDGVIDKYDIVYLGNSMPSCIGGFGLDLKYKDLRLKTFFQYRVGQSVINKSRMNSENMYNANNQSTAVLKRWRREGDAKNTDIPRALWSRGYNYLGSDRFVERGDFIRLKQVTLSYSLPKHIIQRANISRASLYVTSYDLFTWTNYTGQNPEVGIQGGLYPLAIDNDYTPRPIRIAVGCTVEF